MPIKALSLSILSSILFCVPALADQCQALNKKQALLAVAQLNLRQTIYELCEPCGEKRPRAVRIAALSAQTGGTDNYWRVRVNNKDIDLAYIFVDLGDSRPVNLANASGCPATGVSKFLPR